MNGKIYKKLMETLPETPPVINSSDYPRSAVLAALHMKNGEPCLVFQKRSENIRQGGEICFPGGRFDESRDRNMLETAVRETMEEMGVSREQIEVLGQTGTLVASMGAVITCFLGELKIDSLSDLRYNRDEVARVFSVPLKWFIDNPPAEYKVQLEVKPRYTDDEGNEVILLPVEELGLPDRYSKPWGRGSHGVYVYRTAGETIWGITAQLIRHLSELLKEVV